jgi:two-component system phosphate regulon sensor histidine kinase PhoR
MTVSSELWPTFVAGIGVGAVAGGCAAGIPGAIAAAAAGAVAAAVASIQVQRHWRQAQALVHRPELRAHGSKGAGVFAPLLDELLPQIDQWEATARRTSRLQTESDALLRVRELRIVRLESALQQFNDAVVLCDTDGELLFWNTAALRMLSADAGTQAVAANNFELPQVLSDFVRSTASRSEATRSRTLECELPVRGAMCAYRAVAACVGDAEQRPLGVSLVLRDIREEQAEKTRHAEFVSSVSHELKTPLASMKAFLEMLIDGDVTDAQEQSDLYGFMDLQIDRLTRLINNMLNLARIQSGVIRVQRQDSGLNDVLQKALAVAAPTAAEKQIAVIPELSEMYLPVHVDPDLFGQAVINLLSNAIKYTPDGGEVRLRSREGEDEAIIEVRDTGMGIPADSLPKLFQRFYRVPENNKAAAGTGLGLALVKYIVEDVHNGRIMVESEVGAGSCFSIVIPLGHQKTTRRRPELAACTA